MTTAAADVAPTGRSACRNLQGFYSADQRGSTASDGSFLDRLSSDRRHALSTAWIDPACELLICRRAEVWSFLPPEERFCPRHGPLQPPPLDPYPLEGDELRAAKDAAWAKLVKNRVSDLYHHVAFETCDPTPAVEAARAFLEVDRHAGRLVMEEGHVGCGKTTSLICAYRELVLESRRVANRDGARYWAWPDLCRVILGDPDEREDVLDECRQVPVLLIDDIGSSYVKPGGFIQGCAEELLVEREAERRPALLSTNLSPKAFGAAFGARVLDRLRGQQGRWLRLPGGSLRRKNRP